MASDAMQEVRESFVVGAANPARRHVQGTHRATRESSEGARDLAALSKQIGYQARRRVWVVAPRDVEARETQVALPRVRIDRVWSCY